MRAAAIFTFDKCIYLRAGLRLTTARRLSAYMSSRALATTTTSSYCYFLNKFIYTALSRLTFMSLVTFKWSDFWRSIGGVSLCPSVCPSQASMASTLLTVGSSVSDSPSSSPASQRWLRGAVVERRSLTGELSLSCARPTADGWPLTWVNRPL